MYKFISRGGLFSIVLIGALLYSCQSKTGDKATQISNDISGKVTVVDATSHDESESQVLNLFINSYWGVDSMMKVYENLEPAYEPLMIYDIIEEKEFFSSSASGSIKNYLNPMICVFMDGDRPVDGSSDLLQEINKNKYETIPFSSNNQTITIYKFRDVWCKNQWVIVIPIGQSQTLDDFNANRLQIERWMVENEMALGIESIQGNSTYRDSISKLLFDKYGIGLGFKYTFNWVMDKPSANGRVIWLRNENAQNHSNIMIQLIDSLVDLKSLDLNTLISDRNNFTKNYLKNSEGGWMEVTESGGFPHRITRVADHIVEFSGWYSELNTTRRGPFIRKYLVDTHTQRTIILDAFIFAPNQPRVPMMRELTRYVNSIESIQN